MNVLRRYVLACAIAVLPATVGMARAFASPSARLVYARSGSATSCPDELALRRAVAARVGYDPFFPSAKIVVVADVSGDDHSLVAHIQMVDSEGISKGARDLRSERTDCAELFDALALSISIAIDPQALAAPPPLPVASPIASAASEPQPVAPSPIATREVSAAADEPPRAPPEPVMPRTTTAAPTHVSVGGGALAATGVAPAPSVGVELFGTLRRRAWSVALDLRADLPSSARTQLGTVESWLVAASPSLCGHIGAFFGCALGTIGRVGATSSGVLSPSSDSAAYWGAGGRLGFEFALWEALTLRVHGDLLANLRPMSYRLYGQEAWTAPWASGAIGADLGYRIW